MSVKILEENFDLEKYKDKMVRGSVWYVKLTGEGSVQQGIRPCIIISNEMNNKFSPTVSVVSLTTKKMFKKLPTHVFIKRGTLEQNSIALCEQVITVDKKQIKKYVGQLENDYIDKINRAMMIQLQLESDEYNKNELEENKEGKTGFDRNYIYEIINTINETIFLYDRIKSDLLVNLIKENVNILKEYCKLFGVNDELYTKKYKKYTEIKTARNFITNFNKNNIVLG